MPTSPHGVKSVTIAFHDAKGLTPPEPKLNTEAMGGSLTKESAPDPQSFGGGTQLSPLESALFPSWMRANGVDPDSTDGHTYDYKGVYRQTQGQVHPPGTLSGVADTINQLHASRPPMLAPQPGMSQPGMPMAVSHPPQLTAPGMPSFPQAIQDKVGILQQGGASPDADPIRSLMNMLQAQGQR